MFNQLAILGISIVGNLLLADLALRANPRNKSNQLYVLLVIVTVFWLIATYATYQPPFNIPPIIFVRTAMFFACAQIYSLFLFVHTYPYDKIKLKKRYLLPISVYTVVVMVFALSPFLFTGIKDGNPTPGPAIPLFALLALGGMGSVIYLLINKTRHAHGVLRRQLVALSIGITITFSLIAISNFVILVVFHNGQFIGLTPIYTLILFSSIAYAIIAHHLFDIRLIIKRTLIYSTLLLFVLGTYSLVVVLLGSLFGGMNPFTLQTILPNLLAAFLVAIGFEPLRRWLQEVTEKFLFKKEYEEQTVLKELAKKLNDVVALDEALEIMMKMIVKVLHLRHAVTFVFQPGENGTQAIKRIKQIGYSSTAHLLLGERDFTIQYFSSHPSILLVDTLEEELEKERQSMEDGLKHHPKKSSTELSTQIREHAIKQSVVKKLRSLDAELVIPLYLNEQPIGLILLSDKLSGDNFNREDMLLLDTIGAQAISSIQKAKLYEGDQMKSEFVSIASHELLTPISAIEGYLSMILEENIGKVDPQARDYLNKVYTSAKRLSLLIKDLLSVSRIEAGRLKIEPQQLDVNKIIQDTIDQLKFVAQDKGLAITYNKPYKPLPPVWADPDRSMQVMVNLVSNAIKYTPKGSILIETSLKTHTVPCVEVSVTDTGIGMTPQAQAHLFEKFYRVDSPETTGIVGTGLGLYITKSILERMGGGIQIKSAVGKGSTFSFYLPLFKIESSTTS